MRVKEFINETIKIGQKRNAAAKDWINKVYSKFEANPIDSRQSYMVFGEKPEQQVVVFELVPSFDVEGAVEIKWMQSTPTGSGAGRKAMKILQDLATQDNMSLTLFPWEDSDIGQDNLIKFYMSMGFKPIDPGYPDLVWNPGQITESMKFDTRRNKNSFAIDLSIDGKPAGSFQYNRQTGRTLVELDTSFHEKGLGKLLILQGIYTAAMLGMEYVEDESRTAAFDNAMDSLADSGFIVNDDEYWYVTDVGEKHLKKAFK
jgi:hypothetical protein